MSKNTQKTGQRPKAKPVSSRKKTGGAFITQHERQKSFRPLGLPGELPLTFDYTPSAATLAHKPKSPADDVVHTLEVKPTGNPLLERLEKARKQCREVAFSLEKRVNTRNSADVLAKAAQNIRNCSIWGVFRSLSDEVNYKEGTALCKNRLCPNCQRVLAAKRKQNFLDWYELNRAELRKYYFYHLVLTVRHDEYEELRNNLYTAELLRYFSQLRGSGDRTPGWRERKKWWDEKVAGGVYSTEIKPGSDSSPHIHIHVLLVARGLLWNRIKESKFKARALAEWTMITNGSHKGVFIEPVYYLDEQGERVNCVMGTTQGIEKAVSEAIKYTMKSDAQALEGYSDTFLRELLTFRNRYYGRFGILTPKHPGSKALTRLDMLCTDYKDLEQLDRLELSRLFNPDTGEIVAKEDTKLAITPFRNTRPHVAPLRLRDEDGNLLDYKRGETPPGGEVYYSLLDASAYSVVRYDHDQRQKAALVLARSLKRAYDSETDLL